MVEHILKTWPVYFDRLWSGEKTFEVRKDDRGYQAGDTLVLREFDPDHCPDSSQCRDKACEKRFTGREMRFTVGFIYRQGAGLDCGEYVVMSLLEAQQPPTPAEKLDPTEPQFVVRAQGPHGWEPKVWHSDEPEPAEHVVVLEYLEFNPEEHGNRYVKRFEDEWAWVAYPDSRDPGRGYFAWPPDCPGRYREVQPS